MIYHLYYQDLPLTNLKMRDSTKSTKKIKNKIFAIPADAPAIPPKPKNPAIKAIITKVMTQRNIFQKFYG